MASSSSTANMADAAAAAPASAAAPFGASGAPAVAANGGAAAPPSPGGGGLPGPPPGPPPPGGPEAAAAAEEVARQLAFFAPAFERLLSIARMRMRCGTAAGGAAPCLRPLLRGAGPRGAPRACPEKPKLWAPPPSARARSAPDDLGELSSAARADWKRARAAWGDVLVDAALPLRPERSLALLLAPLHDVGRAVAGGAPFDWQAAELALHCVRWA
jgi:hypothetical protein